MAIRGRLPDIRETHLIGARTRESLVLPGACAALGPLGIQMCGLTVARAPYLMVRTGLGFAEVLVTRSGRGQVFAGGEWREVGRGEAYVAPKGCVQAFRPAPGALWKFAWVHYLEEPGSARAVGGQEARVGRADPEGLWAAVAALFQEGAGENDAEVRSHLAAWVDLLARRAIRGGGGPDPRLRKAWGAVEAEPAAAWSAARLAHAAGIGKEQFRRLSLKAHGMPPMARVTAIRMERAAALLRLTPWTNEAVADAVGYSTAFSFSAAFKRHHGVAPSRFRAGRT